MFKKRLGEKLGGGGEKTVYKNPENPEHAIGIFHKEKEETPYQIKGRFYLTKILHLLFPKQIPDMHMAASDPHMIEVDRVNGKDMVFTQSGNVSDDLQELRKKFNDLGAYLDEGDDLNFKYDQEGNLVYLDSVTPFQVDERYYDPEKIKAAIEKLEEDKKAQGLVFLKRLEELYQEQLVSIKDGDKNNK